MNLFIKRGQFAVLGTLTLLLAPSPVSAQQVINNDLVVKGSLCVGFDCPNNPAFGFDTIQLQENNLRIAFIDTSNTASFPTTDWEITINDSTNGGQARFSVLERNSGRIPFTIEDGAAANSLYVDGGNSGRIGLKTSAPVVELHMRDGDTPTVRLEQDGSSGFDPQTWDLAGNEANFFVRDVTNGSTLPFKIRPSSKTGSIDINSSTVVINEDGRDVDFRVEGDLDTNLFIVDAGLGKIGIGVPNATPLAKLDVRDNTGSGPEQMLRLVNNGAPQLFMRNSSSGAEWIFSAGTNMLLAPADNVSNPVFDLSNTGNLTIDGTLTELSDKNAKMAIEPIDTGEILAKVTALPVSTWTYKHDANSGVRHIGPMAQDFYAAFGTGHTDKGISTLDSSGVALAAIQALSQQNAEQRALIESLSKRLRVLEATTVTK